MVSRTRRTTRKAMTKTLPDGKCQFFGEFGLSRMWIFAAVSPFKLEPSSIA